MSPFRLGAAFALIAAMAAAPVSRAVAQSDLRELTNRIERLQRDIDVLQRTVATQAPAAAPASAGAGAAAPAPVRPAEGFAGQVDQRFSQLEGLGREQTGKLEEIQYRLRQMESRMEKLIQDVEFRFQQLERGAPGNGAPSSGQAPATGTPSAAAAPAGQGAAQAPAAGTGAAGGQRLMIVPSGTSAQALQQQASAPREPVRLPAGPPEAQYEFAYGLLLQAQRGQADFAPAEEAMKAFLAQNPNHRQSGAAQYWYGETLYARRDWNGAAIAFAEGFKKYPNSDKAPDNLLRLGMSLGQLNRKPEACAALGEIAKRHPDSPQALRQNAQRERQKLGC